MGSLAAFVPALLGGMLIGLAATLLRAGLGRTAGISGIVGSVLTGPERGWRLVFLGTMIVVGAVAAGASPALVGSAHVEGTGALLLAGTLVGVGTQIGGGCTSGHGVCGIARRSPRSILATATFIGVGMAVVALGRTVMS